MAVKVSNLKIALQNGTTNTLYASWDFNTTSSNTTTTTTSSAIKKGTVVNISSDAKYYNGVDVPDFVVERQWIVMENPEGDRVVINKDTKGEYAICSPINAKYLTVVSGGSSGSSGSSTVKVTNLDHYEVKWYYYTNGDTWFSAGTSDTNDKNAVYSFPSNATKVKVSVKPVSKTKTEGGNTKSYWTGTASVAYYTTYEGKPEDVSSPFVEIEDYTLTATLDNITDGKADKIEFEVYKGNTRFSTGISNVRTQRAIYTCKVSAGGKYRVRCRAINSITSKNTIEGEWSTYSNEVTTIPPAVTNVKCSVDTKTSVKVTWKGSSDATSYEVAYTTKKEYFDSSNEVSSMTVENNTAFITGLDSGDEWFFRVRARNDKGDSGWSNIVSTVLGTKPSAPTTWSLTTTAMVDDEVTLYWVHNTEDGSKQTEAEIELNIGGKTDVIKVTTETSEDEEEKTYSHTLSLHGYSEGAKIRWRVRTKGITGEYGDWSIQRTIDIYAPPTLMVDLGSDAALSAFPLNITATASPTTQKPVSYHVSIQAVDSYDVMDYNGKYIRVSAGQEVYSKIFNKKSNPLSVKVTAGDVTLQNDQMYKVVVTVAMDSGLTASNTAKFKVVWGDETYSPDAGIAIDKEACCAYITPFCLDRDENYISEVLLSVYRREPDGGFVEIAKDVVNNGAISVTDPHPSLDYARYRIVARHKNTGIVDYSDLPGVPINEPAIIIQWDEDWDVYDFDEEAPPETPPCLVGSLVRLPYNVDTNETHNRDVSLIEYIGRKHPVSYYGTQRGTSASWSTEIPKTDIDTIYALRRLSIWDGDVYVREPSGTGYWAQISVSMSFKHTELTVPVSIDVKRVEGGGI